MANQFNIKFKVSTDTKGIDELKSKLKTVRDSIDGNTTDMSKFSSEIKNSVSEVDKLINALNSASNNKMGAFDLSNFQKSLSSSNANLSTLQNALISSGAKGATAWSDLNSRILTANSNIKNTGTIVDNISNVMKTAFSWNISTAIFQGIGDKISEAYNYCIKLDDTLNDIRIVTRNTKQEMSDFAVEANNAANALGASTLTYADASLIYAQQGLVGEELKERARITTEVANVTNKAADEISQRLTAVWNGYKVEASEAELYVDKMSAVAAETASDLDQLSEGMSKVASAANVVGFDIDRLNAGLSTVISVTQQSASKIGNSFKTILARLGDLSLDFSKGDEFGVTMGDVSGILNKLGISILDSNNNLREMSYVFDELGEKWKTFNAAQKQAASVALGGKYQYNTIISWLDNYEMYQKALKTSMEAEGALQEQQDIYMERTSTHLKQLTNEWEGLFNTIMDNDGLNSVIDVLSNAVNLVDNFERGLGGGLSALTANASTLSMIFSKQLAGGISNAISKFQQLKQVSKNDSMLSSFADQIDVAKIRVNKQDLVGTKGDLVEAKASLSALEKQRDRYSEILKYKRLLTQEEKESLLNDQGRLYQIEKQLETLKGQSVIVDQIKVKEDSMAQSLDKIRQLSEQMTLNQNAYDDNELTINSYLAKQMELRKQIINIVKNQEILSETQISQEFTKASQSLDLAELERQAQQKIIDIYSQKGISQERLNQIERTIISGKDQELQKEREILIANQNVVFEQKSQIDHIQKIINGLSAAATVAATMSNVIKTMTDESATAEDKINSVGSTVTQLGFTMAQLPNPYAKAIGYSVSAISSILTPVISNWAAKEAKALEELEEKFYDLKSNMPKRLQDISELESLSDRYEVLSQGVDRFGKNISLTKEEYTEFQGIIEKAVSMSDDLVLGYDAEGKAIVDKNEFLKEEISLLKEKLELEKKEIYSKKNIEIKTKADKESYENAKKDLEKANKEANFGSGDSHGSLEMMLQYMTQRDNELSEEAPKVLNGSYAKLKNILLKSNFDYEKMYNEVLGMSEKELKEATEMFEGKDKEMFEGYLNEFIAKRAEYGVNKRIAESKLDNNKIDIGFVEGLFQVDYSQTAENLKKIGGEQADGLLKAYISGLKFSDEMPDYMSMASNINDFANNLINIFSDNELQTQIINMGDKFEGTYQQYIDKVNEIVENYKDDFTSKDGKVSENIINSIFGFDSVNLDETTGRINDFTNGVSDELETKLNEIPDRLQENGVKDKIRQAIYDNFSKEELENNLEDIFNYADYFSNLDDTGDKLGEKIDFIKRKLDFQDTADKTRSQIVMISTALDKIAEGGSLTKEESKLFGELESQFPELLESGQRFGEEYTAILRRIREEASNSTMMNLVEEANLLRETLKDLDPEINTEEYFRIMDELRRTNIEIDVNLNANVDSTLNDIYGMIDQFQAATELLTDNYQITIDQAVNFVKNGYGEMLNGALAADEGMIQLNEEVVTNFINGKQTEINASKQQKVSELQDEKTVLINKKNILSQKLEALQQASNAETEDGKAKALVLAAQYQGDYDSYCLQVASKVEKAEDANVEMSEDASRLTEFLGSNTKIQTENQIQAAEDADTASSNLVNNTIGYFSQLCMKLQEVSLNVKNAMVGGPVTNSDISVGKKGINKTASNPKMPSKGYEKTNNSNLSDSSDYDAVSKLLEKTNAAEVDSVINQSISQTKNAINQLDSQITAIDGAINTINAASVELDTKKKEHSVNWKNYNSTTGDPDDSPAAKRKKKLEKIGGSKKQNGGKSGGSNKKDKKNGGGSKKGKNTKGGKSGDSGTSISESDYIDEELDAYHNIDILLDKITSKYEDVERYKEKAYGKRYLSALSKENDLLNTQLTIQRQKLAIVRSSLKEEKAQLSGKYGVKFNANGSIKDYNSEILKWQKYYNTKMKNDPDRKSDYKEYFEDFKKLMVLYETNLHKTKQETLDAIEETKNKLYEIELEKFTYSIQIKLENKDIKRDWINFCQEIADTKAENIIAKNIVGSMKNSFKEIQTYLKKDGTLKTLTDSINSTIADKTMKSADKERLLKDYFSQIQDAYIAVQKLKKEIENAYIDSIEQAKDAFSEHLNQYDEVSSKIEHQRELIELTSGETDYIRLKDVADAQHKNNLGELDFLRKQVAYWSSMSGKFKEGTKEWEKWHSELQSATEKLNKSIEESIKNLQDAYKVAVDEIFYNLDSKLSNGSVLNLKDIGDQWERIQKKSSKYLDTIESIQGIETFIDKINTSIAETDNVSVQEKLKKLQQEQLNYLNSKEKLTQYDLDRAEALYQVALKQASLEDIQNSKHSMKMVRDQQGNYTYNYVADTSEVKDAEQELRDAQNSLYELDVDAYNDNLSSMYDIYKEWQEKIKELYLDTSLSQEELQTKQLELADYYGEMLTGICSENETIKINLNQSTFDTLYSLYQEDEERVKKWVSKVTGIAYTGWNDIENDSENILNKMNGGYQSVVQDMIDSFSANPDSLKNIMLETYDQLQQANDDYDTKMSQLESTANVSFSEINNNLRECQDETQTLADKNQELIDKYSELSSTIDGVYSNFGDFIATWDKLEVGAKDAAQAAKDYLDLLNKVNGTSVKTTSNTNANSSSTSGSKNNTTSTKSSSKKKDSDKSKSGNGDGKITKGESVTLGSVPYYYDSEGTKPCGSMHKGDKVYVTNINSKGKYPYHVSTGSSLGNGDLGWVKKSQLKGFDTGGGTGDWSGNEGRLALLHKKELILNKTDTKNVLEIIKYTREMTKLQGLCLSLGNKPTKQIQNTQNNMSSNLVIENLYVQADNAMDLVEQLQNLPLKARQEVNKN